MDVILNSGVSIEMGTIVFICLKTWRRGIQAYGWKSLMISKNIRDLMLWG